MLLPFIVAIAVATFITLIICVWFGRRSPDVRLRALPDHVRLRHGHGGFGPAAAPHRRSGLRNPRRGGRRPHERLFLPDLPAGHAVHAVRAAAGYPIVWVFAAVIIATPIAMYLLKFIRKPAFSIPHRKRIAHEGCGG